MATELQDLLADLELSIVDTVERINEAELNLLYVAVLDLEQRIETLHDVSHWWPIASRSMALPPARARL